MSKKKLSFGFTNKIVKKTIVIPTKAAEPQTSVQLIDYLEGQTIKIKGAVIEEKKPLIIPIQLDDKNLVDRVIAAKKLKERSNKRNDVENLDNRPDSELSLDELAARQLIREAKSNLTSVTSKNGSTKVHVVPVVEDTLILEGSKEPTLHDYENVPIGDFGLAMLRGMGWTEATGIGRDKMSVSVAVPELRPKGMGLGAFKMVQDEVPKNIAVDANGKELSLVKGAFAKVIAGKEKGFYCKIEGLDDEAGRIIVKMAIKGTALSLNEFMLCPVTQEEYSASSLILNNSKYRDYQKKEAMSSDQVNFKNKASTSNQGTHDSKMIKTEEKKNEHDKIKSRSPIIIKKESKHKEKTSKRSGSYERTSPERNIKNTRGRSRSLSIDKKPDSSYRKNIEERDFIKDNKMYHKGDRRSYKSRSRSPSYHRKDKKESCKLSKYRSRSKEHYQGSHKHQNRRSRSSSIDSPPRDKNKHSTKSPKEDKKKSKYSTTKHGRNSSCSSDEQRLKTKDKHKKSASKDKLEKSRRNYSESESESDYDTSKRAKDKSVTKYNKDKKSKSSKKYDNSDSSFDDGKKRSHSRKEKRYSSESDSSDAIRYKKNTLKRR